MALLKFVEIKTQKPSMYSSFSLQTSECECMKSFRSSMFQNQSMVQVAVSMEHYDMAHLAGQFQADCLSRPHSSKVLNYMFSFHAINFGKFIPTSAISWRTPYKTASLHEFTPKNDRNSCGHEQTRMLMI